MDPFRLYSSPPLLPPPRYDLAAVSSWVLTQALDLWELDGCPLVAGGGAEQENNVTSQTSCDKTSLESRLSMEINVD